MKNLLERLKPEVMQKISYENLKYPLTMESLKHNLRITDSILDIKISDAFKLSMLMNDNLGISELVSYFEEIE